MGLSEEIYQEGLRIPPVALARGGKIQRDVLAILLANVRTPREREGDLMAQVAACRLGERRLQELLQTYGTARTGFYLEALQSYSARLMKEALAKIPAGTYTAEDFLDDDGHSAEPVRLRVAIKIRGGSATVDFQGTSPQCAGCVNAVFAITYSAVFYVFRCLLGENVPACAGLMDPIEVRAPEGSVVNARPPAAVAAGNVETSQRIVDVLLRALAQALPQRIPAASSGTMNNLSFGGMDPRTGEPFAYYETIAGGMGARPSADGLSGVHTHMTNSLNTPIEALESAYPVRVRRYSLRRGSGGKGKFRGGEGIVREIEFLTEVRGSILSDRRLFSPYGLAGGKPGRPGRNQLTVQGRKHKLPGKAAFNAPSGSVLRSKRREAVDGESPKRGTSGSRGESKREGETMEPFDRRDFIKTVAGTAAFAALEGRAATPPNAGPVFLSTWAHGKPANERAAEVFKSGGSLLDAIEKGINVPESDPNVTSVGYGGIPNAEGVVELDAAIMDGTRHRAGSVCNLHMIKNPISVARLVMEKTRHTTLAGEGAFRFALEDGV